MIRAEVIAAFAQRKNLEPLERFVSITSLLCRAKTFSFDSDLQGRQGAYIEVVVSEYC